MSLSWENGTPFALVSGGSKNGEKLHFSNAQEEETYEDPIAFLDQLGFFKDLKKEPKHSFEELRRLLIDKGEIVDEEVKELYEKAQKTLNEQNGKAAFLDSGVFSLLPSPGKKREVLYIAAPSGAGKTAFACQYMLLGQKMFGKRFKTFIFTAKPYDKTIQRFRKMGLKYTMYDVNETDEEGELELLKEENILDATKFESCFVFFDDIEFLPNQKLVNVLVKFRNNVTALGRERDVSVLTTSHAVTNYIKTREMLVEATWVVLYPHSGIRKGLHYFFKTYMHLDEQQKKKILKLHTRWLAFHTTEPNLVLAETSCHLLND